MQDERDVHGLAQPFHQGEIEGRVAGQHGVRAADRDGQRVNPGGRDVAGRLVRVGASQRVVHAVLAADLPEFGLDPDAPVLAPEGHLGGSQDVLGVRPG